MRFWEHRFLSFRFGGIWILDPISRKWWPHVKLINHWNEVFIGHGFFVKGPILHTNTMIHLFFLTRRTSWKMVLKKVGLSCFHHFTNQLFNLIFLYFGVSIGPDTHKICAFFQVDGWARLGGRPIGIWNTAWYLARRGWIKGGMASV